MPALALSLRDPGGVLRAKVALANLASLCGGAGAVEFGAPERRAGWTFLDARVPEGLLRAVEGRFAGMIGRRGGRAERLEGFLSRYLEARGAPCRARLSWP